jgi:hypothetical protein
MNSLGICLKSDIAKARANQIVKFFSDSERVAHGRQPIDPNFGKLLEGIYASLKELHGTRATGFGGEFAHANERMDFMERYEKKFGAIPPQTRREIQRDFLHELTGQATPMTGEEEASRPMISARMACSSVSRTIGAGSPKMAKCCLSNS